MVVEKYSLFAACASAATNVLNGAPPVVGRFEGAVLASEMDQGLAVAAIGVKHFADEDIVVAGGDDSAARAFDGRENTAEEGRAGLARMPFDALEAVVAGACEALGEGALRFAKYVDGEELAVLQCFEDFRAGAHAYRNHRGAHGDGGKGTGGHAVQRAVRAFRGDDGYAARESSANAAKMAGINDCRLKSGCLARHLPRIVEFRARYCNEAGL
jgi:hypothetical protein